MMLHHYQEGETESQLGKHTVRSGTKSLFIIQRLSHFFCEWVRAESLHSGTHTHTHTYPHKHTASEKPISPCAGTGINVEVICFNQLNRHLLELDSDRLHQPQPPSSLPLFTCVRTSACARVAEDIHQSHNLVAGAAAAAAHVPALCN